MYVGFRKRGEGHLLPTLQSAFSDFKRLVGEVLRSTTMFGKVKEVRGRVLAYNNHKRVRADMIGISGLEVLLAED